MDMEIAICDGPQQIRLERRPVEALGPADVLVRIAYCGVCPWDVRAYNGLSSSVRYPLQLGHEVAGEVAGLGADVRGCAVGDRVAVDVIRRCGVCRACRRGFENMCAQADSSRGGFAEYIVMPAKNVYRLRDGTKLIEASLAEPLACVVRGQRRVSVATGDTALVMGCGPLGLLHIQALRASGARVIGADLLDRRLEVARHVGADVTVNPDQQNLSQIVAAETDGAGVDVAIVAVSQLEAARQALPQLGGGGRLLLFAGIYPRAELVLDPNLIHYRELLVTGTSDYAPAEFAAALRLIQDGIVQTAPLISQVYPLTEVMQALASVSARKGLKTVVRCSDLEPFEPEVIS
jgi:L-iditol 2-dehydrogenase